MYDVLFICPRTNHSHLSLPSDTPWTTRVKEACSNSSILGPAAVHLARQRSCYRYPKPCPVFLAHINDDLHGIEGYPLNLGDISQDSRISLNRVCLGIFIVISTSYPKSPYSHLNQCLKSRFARESFCQPLSCGQLLTRVVFQATKMPPANLPSILLTHAAIFHQTTSMVIRVLGIIFRQSSEFPQNL
jgi:hypothetical protein